MPLQGTTFVLQSPGSSQLDLGAKSMVDTRSNAISSGRRPCCISLLCERWRKLSSSLVAGIECTPCARLQEYKLLKTVKSTGLFT